MSVWYLESDDEITDAVARLRATEDERVVLVVPPGSRIATGRINFRLLAREASARNLAFAVVSPDEQVRALAIAGGVVARGSIEEAEGALDRGEPPAPLVATGTAVTQETAHDADPTDQVGDAEDGGAVAMTTTAIAGSTRRRRLAVTSVIGIGLIVVGGWAGLRFLPTASITLDPKSAPLGPILVSVTASAANADIDVTRGDIPAQAIEIPLTVQATYGASGRERSETAAVGTVVFSSEEQPFPLDIPAGTRVATEEGIEFETIEAVTLPSTGSGSAEVEAPVEAVVAGPEGNVEAGTVTQTSLAEAGIVVTNPQPTAGGVREERPLITQDDYLAATADLQNRLSGELRRRVLDPEIVPDELTLFAETAQLGALEHRPAADELVGTSAPEFELTGVATGTVLAVDESLIERVTVPRLAAQAPEGMTLLPASVETQAGTGTVRGEVIGYAASATGTAYADVEPEALVERLRGLPVSEAQSILEAFGTAKITVWPDFLGTLPEDSGRIDLAVEGPTAPDHADGG